ncbi:hypothetical protein [Streptantibioticus ferralitis]|uniref:Uncharacterized protein n=1 Tax=Streptantibioticus ferralitis TaxID=236510 RepID=A0ABT5ZBH2_9ACTN|nr:hypothetical protein [Streptantibioticus ferralitis]MDF2260896.1 hypothetical protein [Streptantibioticus ferralitis]
MASISAPTPEYGAPYLPITTARSKPVSAHLERVDIAELDAEQRRWLPDPIPPDLRMERCTGCGLIAANIPGPGLDPWKKHWDYCPGEPEPDEDED